MTVYHDLDVGQNSRIRQTAVPSFERRIEPDGQNLVPVLHTLYTGDREFKRNIDSAMHAAFGSDYEEIVFPPAADRRIQFRVRWKSLKREQPAADLSDGTLRFLLLLTALITPEPPMVIAIDEPETGLHPAMLPIIAEFAVEAASRTQIVFTTHSPQFLDAFTGAKPTTTVAKWENGETTLHTLEGEDLAYWLEDYSLGRLFQSGQLEAMT
jgi:predicted ATPase